MTDGSSCQNHGKICAILESSVKTLDHHEESLKELNKSVNLIARNCSDARSACVENLSEKRRILSDKLYEEIEETRELTGKKVPWTIFFVLISILVTVCGFLYSEQRQTNDTLIDIKVSLERTVSKLESTADILDKHMESSDRWKNSFDRKLNKIETEKD